MSDLKTVVREIEDILPAYPFGVKAEMVAKSADVSVEEAKEALREYQHSTEI